MAVTLGEFREKYGLSLVDERTYTIYDSPTLIAKNNPNRFELLVTNLGTEPLYVGFSPAVSSTRGIRVASGGGVTTISVAEDGQATCQEIYAISTVTGTNVYVQEYEAWKR